MGRYSTGSPRKSRDNSQFTACTVPVAVHPVRSPVSKLPFIRSAVTLEPHRTMATPKAKVIT